MSREGLEGQRAVDRVPVDSLADFAPSPSLAKALSGGIVRVGTENRAKLGAVHDALAPFAKPEMKLSIVPVGVPSNVPDQPIGWSEIVAGARNRARAAFASGECALAVGIEDGLVCLSEDPTSEDLSDYFNVGCAWLTDGTREGHGFSSGFAYPPGSLEPAVEKQSPIGDLFDDLWQKTRRARTPTPSEEPDSEAPATPLTSAKPAPSGRGGGNIGLLTGARLERSAYGSQAVICALVRFLHTDLYD
jgi:inosine/xanthosine triphosphatase